MTSAKQVQEISQKEKVLNFLTIIAPNRFK